MITTGKCTYCGYLFIVEDDVELHENYCSQHYRAGRVRFLTQYAKVLQNFTNPFLNSPGIYFEDSDIGSLVRGTEGYRRFWYGPSWLRILRDTRPVPIEDLSLFYRSYLKIRNPPSLEILESTAKLSGCKGIATLLAELLE